MDFQQVQARALAIREQYEAFALRKWGKTWTREQSAAGFVGDVGDLMKLVLAKSGVRVGEDEGLDAKMAHELSDCLYSIIILSHGYQVDLEAEFFKTMDGLEQRIKNLE